ncbi:hypothetical protein Tco_0208407 [Tanacetum coccineum]
MTITRSGMKPKAKEELMATVEMEMVEMEMVEMETVEMRIQMRMLEMETMFYISNCPKKSQVKYATCTLLDDALTWWNSHKRTIGIEAAFSMSWRELMKLMTEVYCSKE